MSSRPIALHTITDRDAAHVLTVVGDEGGGLRPGSFTEKLIEAALLADDSNRERLERGFEGLISAVRAYKELPTGLKILRELAAPPRPF